MSDYEREFYAQLDALAEEAFEAAVSDPDEIAIGDRFSSTKARVQFLREAVRTALRRGYLAGFRHGFVTCARAADSPHLRPEYVAHRIAHQDDPELTG